MSLSATVKFPNMCTEDLERFRDLYGVSAFVCRYHSCRRSSDGFNSIQERNKHEKIHEVKFRCEDPRCFLSPSGFATVQALSRHNEQWHPTSADSVSLSVLISHQSSQENRSAPERDLSPPDLVQPVSIIDNPFQGERDDLAQVQPKLRYCMHCSKEIVEAEARAHIRACKLRVKLEKKVAKARKGLHKARNPFFRRLHRENRDRANSLRVRATHGRH